MFLGVLTNSKFVELAWLGKSTVIMCYYESGDLACMFMPAMAKLSTHHAMKKWIWILGTHDEEQYTRDLANIFIAYRFDRKIPETSKTSEASYHMRHMFRCYPYSWITWLVWMSIPSCQSLVLCMYNQSPRINHGKILGSKNVYMDDGGCNPG